MNIKKMEQMVALVKIHEGLLVFIKDEACPEATELITKGVLVLGKELFDQKEDEG